MTLGGLADHMRRNLHAMAIPQVQHSRNTFAIAISEPCVGGSIGRHALGKSPLGNGLSVPFGGCPPASNCIETEITRRMPSGQKPLFVITFVILNLLITERA